MSSRDLANLKNGLVAAWIPSLGSTGYRLVDRVGSNHGVLTNMDAASDWVVSGGNLSLDFDGSNDYVDIDKNSKFVSSGDKTLCGWLKTTVSSGDTQNCILGSAISSGGRANFCITINFQEPNKLNYWQDAQGRLLSSNTSVNTGDWLHWAITRQGNLSTIFINGIEDNSATSLIAPQTDGTGYETAIGRFGGFNGYYTPMQVDDIRIYSRALSATEISLLSKERGIGFKTSSRTSSHFAKRYAYKPPKDKTYAAITRSQSDYDSLREGLVLAICPSVSGATGYRAVDVSGRGNHGTLTNMTPEDWVPSGGALSLDFDGSNDFVLTANSLLSGSTATTTVFSMSSWFYITSLPSGRRQICPARTSGTGLFAALLELGSGKITIRADNGGVAVYAFADTEDAPTNQWVHVCGTWNGATKVATLYKNGIQLGTVDYSASTANPATAQEWLIAALRYDASLIHYFPGQIDDSRVYGRLLTPPEIRLLASRRGIGLQSTPRHTDYLETREKTYSVIVKSQQEHSSLSEGLVGAWCPSLGASGYRLVDRSGYGNHGVLTGMDAATDWVASNGVALDFENLSDDRVSCSSANISMAEGAISLFCRKVAATADDNDYMLWMHFTSVTDRLYLEIQTYLIGGNKNAKFLATFNNNVSNYAVGTTINLNQWYHALVQWKNGFPIEIYIDGRFVSSSSTNYTTNATTTSEFIGNDHANLVGFGGYIDDFRRYTRRLTPSEIRLLASKRGIGLRSQKQTMFYQFPSGSKRRRILTGMP